jgi:hypothetical protein
MVDLHPEGEEEDEEEEEGEIRFDGKESRGKSRQQAPQVI